jgi:alkanesulfonate monooxygenase SsuD/methylene tetrahydromethanopterin reductase-like flavin-dependent oxidoreductase (luciferase family)
VDPSELIATSWEQLHRQLDAYLDAGLTKFVIRPAGEKPLEDFIDRFVTELVPRQN